VRSGVDEAQRPLERLGSTQRLEQVDPLDEATRRGQALLGGGGDDSVRRSVRRFVCRPQQHRRFEPTAGNARTRRHEHLERAPAPEEVHARDSVEAELVVHHDADLRPVPVLQAVVHSGRQVAEHGPWPGVQHG
jgi:hypothetical protein